MTTELNVEGGMHIEPDPKTGAIAASVVNEDIQKIQDKKKDDQPEQTEKAAAEEPKEIPDPRKAIMDNIYANRAKQFKNELEYAAQISLGATNEPAADDQPTAEPAKETPAEPLKEEVVQQPKEQVEQPQVKAKKQYIINGQTVDLTEEELAQLATRSLQQQQIYNQQILQSQQPLRAQQPQQQPAQQTNDADTERLRDIARKITYGSEDESVKALRDLTEHAARNAQRTNGPTAEQIVQAASQQALAQVQLQTNLDTIAREYPEVFEKRSATLVAADYVNSLRNKYNLLGVQKPDIELYREACQLARSEFKAPQENQQSDTRKQPVVNVASTKIERKRATPQPPASVNKVLPQQIERAPTGSDIVNAMRKARGQSAMT